MTLPKRSPPMTKFILKSSVSPHLYVREVQPVEYQHTPIRWGSAEQAIVYDQQKALATQHALLSYNIETKVVPVSEEVA